MLELRQLRYFVEVCRAGQMTQAAERLNIAQPALSQAIAQLEAQVGATLLDRHARGVRTTAVGDALLTKAQVVLDAAADAEAGVAGAARAQRGQLRIGFLSLTSPAMADGMFPAFARRHPEIAVQWCELGFPSANSAAWLAGVDLALTYVVGADAALEVLVLKEEQVVAVVGSDHPLAGRLRLRISEILEETFVKLDPAIDPNWRAFWMLDRHRTQPGRASDEVARTPQEAAAQVTSGRAILTTPAVVAAQFAHLGVVGIPLVDAIPAQLALVWPHDRANPLVDTLTSEVRGNHLATDRKRASFRKPTAPAYPTAHS